MASTSDQLTGNRCEGLFGWLLCLWFALYLGGCTTVILPPRVDADSAPVFLLDHGRHASLVLPAGGTKLVRYAYGDWAYYALAETGAYEASSAVLWPTQGALGRKVMMGPATIAGVERSVRVYIEHIYRFTVARADVERLRHRLLAIYRANLYSLIYNAAYDLEFVHHPDQYTGMHNSNRVVADWLKALGCEVRGRAVFSRWRVLAPDG